MPETAQLPPPLPPSQRTVGQLVAESIRFYGDNFWRALPLGLPIAVLDQLELGRGAAARVGLFVVAAPFLAFAFARAAAMVGGVSPSRRSVAVATATGTAVLLPAALLFTWFALLAVAYLALVGLVVPVAVLEGGGALRAFRRAGNLGRADYIHAAGSLAALVLVFFLSRLVLVLLLHGQADEAMRVAVFLADVVLGPVLLLGASLLYFDQAARVGSAGSNPRRRPDADLHPSVEADAAGRSDAQVEP
jgi:hypothetical protein